MASLVTPRARVIIDNDFSGDPDDPAPDVTRPQGAGYDVGAFEYVPAAIAPSICRLSPALRPLPPVGQTPVRQPPYGSGCSKSSAPVRCGIRS